MPSLMDMPDDVKIEICKELDLKDNLMFRRVCWSLHNFIDDANLNLELHNIDITVHDKQISVFWGSHQVKYVNIDGDGAICKITRNNYERARENLNFHKVFSRDLKIILNIFNPKRLIIRWRGFEIVENFSKVLENFENILKLRPVKVKELRLDVLEKDHVLSILPYLDPKTLGTILIADPKATSTRRRNMEFGDILKLEQLTKAEEFRMPDYEIVDASILDFLNFKKVDISLKNVTVEELVKVKESFLHPASTLHKFTVNYSNFENRQQLPDFFGTPYHILKWGLPQDKWYYRIPNSDDILEITSYDIAKTIDVSL